MKKYLLSMALATACMTVSAQKITVLPTAENPYLMGITMSRNGQYIGGTDAYGMMFVADWKKGVIKYAEPADDTGGQTRGISDNGIGVGFNKDAFLLNFNGDTSIISEGDAIAEGITSDGSVICGETSTDREPHAGYWKDGQYHRLPEPTYDWVGGKYYGTAAKFVNKDASVIIGHVVDRFSTRPLVVWHRNAGDSTYSVNPVFKRYCLEDAHGEQAFGYFQGTGISGNGKWVAVTVLPKGRETVTMARYDVEADTLQLINYPGEGVNSSCVTTAIADDGTLLGFEETELGTRVGLICKGGESEAKSLAETFAGISEMADYDMYMNNPAGISADGRYIGGYAMIDDELIGQAFVTYVIDAESSSAAVEGIKASGAKPSANAFSVDGKRVNTSLLPGIVIEKGADGKVSKILKR